MFRENGLCILVLFSWSNMSDCLLLHGLQHASLRCPSLSPGACSNSCPFSQWCHLTISSSVTLFSSCPQSFPVSGSFPMSQLFISGGQSIRISSALPKCIQGWFPLGFSSTTVRKHQFLSDQPSLWSNFHIHTWLLENHSFDYMDLCRPSDVSAF